MKPWYMKKGVLLLLVLLGLAAIATYFILPHRSYESLQVNTKEEVSGRKVEAWQRQKFATSFEKQFRDRGFYVSVATEGTISTTLRLSWKETNKQFVLQMMNNKESIQDLRELGFKKLLMENESQIWDVDLKN